MRAAILGASPSLPPLVVAKETTKQRLKRLHKEAKAEFEFALEAHRDCEVCAEFKKNLVGKAPICLGFARFAKAFNRLENTTAVRFDFIKEKWTERHTYEEIEEDYRYY